MIADGLRPIRGANKTINKLKYKTMKTEFIECKSRATAYRRAPWASITMKVCGGFIAFESWSDYYTAKNQK